MASAIQSETGTFDAADEVSATIPGVKFDVHVADAGSFSGTIKVYRSMPSGDVEMASYTESDLPLDIVVENAGDRSIYLKCTARSAGSATYDIIGETISS